jgi:hypothetical protein
LHRELLKLSAGIHLKRGLEWKRPRGKEARGEELNEAIVVGDGEAMAWQLTGKSKDLRNVWGNIYSAKKYKQRF